MRERLVRARVVHVAPTSGERGESSPVVVDLYTATLGVGENAYGDGARDARTCNNVDGIDIAESFSLARTYTPSRCADTARW
jgi:hypothetical protein